MCGRKVGLYVNTFLCGKTSQNQVGGWWWRQEDRHHFLKQMVQWQKKTDEINTKSVKWQERKATREMKSKEKNRNIFKHAEKNWTF